MGPYIVSFFSPRPRCRHTAPVRVAHAEYTEPKQIYSSRRSQETELLHCGKMSPLWSVKIKSTFWFIVTINVTYDRTISSSSSLSHEKMVVDVLDIVLVNEVNTKNNVSFCYLTSISLW